MYDGTFGHVQSVLAYAQLLAIDHFLRPMWTSVWEFRVRMHHALDTGLETRRRLISSMLKRYVQLGDLTTRTDYEQTTLKTMNVVIIEEQICMCDIAGVTMCP